MTRNMGSLDRVVRIVVGVGLLAWALLGGTDIADALGLVGVALLITGLAGRCLVYQVLGLSTRHDAAPSHTLPASR